MKKFTELLLFTFVLLSFSACSNTPNPNEIISSDYSNNTNKILSTKEDCMKGCYMLWNSDKNNMVKSESEMEKSCDSLCEAGQGMQNNDPSSCEKAEGIMKDTCYSEIASETNNPALCEKIETQMLISGCYISIVENTKDKSLCEKISESMMKSVCLEQE